MKNLKNKVWIHVEETKEYGSSVLFWEKRSCLDRPGFLFIDLPKMPSSPSKSKKKEGIRYMMSSEIF